MTDTLGGTPPPTTPTTLAPTGAPPPSDQLGTGGIAQGPATTSPDALAGAAAAAPKLEPSVIAGVANGATSAQEAAVKATAVKAQLAATQLADLMSKASVIVQRAAWKAAPDSIKSLLVSAGYQAPQDAPPPSGGGGGLGGFLSSAWHDTAHYFDDARHAGAAATDATFGVLNEVTGDPAQQVNHLWDAFALHVLQNQAGDLSRGQTGFSASTLLSDLNPLDVIRDWNATANGSSSFQPDSVLYVQKVLGITGPTYALAAKVASGTPLQTILAALAPDERQNAALLIEGNKDFQNAVQLLADSHLDLGQFIFGGLSARQIGQLYPQAGNVAPYMVAGQAVGAVGLAASLGSGEGDAEVAAGAEEAAASARGLKLLSRLGDLRKALRTPSAIGLGLGGVAASLAAAGRGESVDTLTATSPFGIQVHPLSGVADGIWDWYMNPLFQGLQARGSYNEAIHGAALLDSLGNARDVRAYYLNNTQGGRLADRFVKLVTSSDVRGETGIADRPNFAALQRAGMSMDKLSEDIRAAYPEFKAAAESDDPMATRRAFGEWMAKETTLVNLFRGRAGLFFKDATVFPHMSLTTDVLERLKGTARDALAGFRTDPGRLSPRQLAVDVFGREAADAGMAAAASDDVNREGRVARFLRRTTNLVPTHAFIDLHSPDVGTQVQRLAAFSLPQDKIDQAVNGFLAIPEWREGRRRTFLKGVIGDVLVAAGVRESAKGREWYDSLFGDEGLLAQRERYSHGTNAHWVDPENPTGPTLSHAILGSQLSSVVALPDFRELYKFAKKSWLMEALQSTVNREGFERFMSQYWRKVVLFRPGFAARVAGEESLNFILRHGRRAWLDARIASSITDAAREYPSFREAVQTALTKRAKELTGDVTATNEADAGGLYHALTSHVPDQVLENIKTPEELAAAVTGWWALRWARRVAIAHTPERILAGAQELAMRGVANTAFEDYIGAVLQRGGGYVDDTPMGHAESLVRMEGGDKLVMSPTGLYPARSKEDIDAIPAWIWSLYGVARSPEGRIAAAAWHRGGHDQQVQAVLDWLEGRDLHAQIDAARKAGVASGGLDRVAVAEAALAQRAKYVQRFAAHFQTKDGRLVETGAATQAQADRDWAEAIVEHVNHLAMTSEGQDLDEEGNVIQPSGRQPIRLPGLPGHRVPFKITSGDTDRAIGYAHEDLAYRGIPEGHVRLFKAENVTTEQRGSRLAAPGRAWSPSYAWARARAGSDGQVYEITVPRNAVERAYTYRGTRGATSYLDQIEAAQHEGVDPGHGGTFESGDIAYARATDESQHRLIDMLAKGQVPSADTLTRVDRAHWPDDIAAPQLTARVDPGNTLAKLLEKGMTTIVGRPLNWLSRQPIFVHNYAESLAEVKAMFKARGIVDVDGSLAHDVAMERAVGDTLPFIHNPRVRSQFAVVYRNVMPFWFAQEQFYKRWGRLFGTYPEAWYKLNLGMQGLKASGFVEPDAYGNESFVYPGSQAMIGLLTKFPFFGSIPVGASFTGEINQLNPSLATGGAPWPSFGPVVTVPMTLMGVMFPKLSSLAQTALGPEAPPINEQGDWTNQLLDQFLPTVASRLLQWAQSPSGGTSSSPSGGPNDIASPLYMSAMISAAQQLEASGHGLSDADSANPRLQQQYLDRLANWTKNLLLMRATFGFFAPATPNIKIADGGLGAEFSALVATMPYDEAVSTFLKLHPDATADTIFSSTVSGKDQSGAYVPATAATAGYINSNLDFFDNYPQLGPWTIPPADANGAFSGSAYDLETALDLRARRSLTSWYDEMKYSEGAAVYFPLEQQVAAAKLRPGADKSAITHDWDLWSAQFKATHPVFAQMDLEPTASERRNAIVTELQAAIQNDALPKNEWSERIGLLMDGFDQVQNAYRQTEGISSDATMHKDNKDAFIAWGNAYAAAYPVIAPFWSGVLMKQVYG